MRKSLTSLLVLWQGGILEGLEVLENLVSLDGLDFLDSLGVRPLFYGIFVLIFHRGLSL